eukprot:5081580-Lingulodinium_polyedra.AAC.1
MAPTLVREISTRHPTRRPFLDFLQVLPTIELNCCKRCGQAVSSFIAEAFPFAKEFKSDPQLAPPT